MSSRLAAELSPCKPADEQHRSGQRQDKLGQGRRGEVAAGMHQVAETADGKQGGGNVDFRMGNGAEVYAEVLLVRQQHGYQHKRRGGGEECSPMAVPCRCSAGRY